MKINGSYHLATDQRQCYDFLQDPRILEQCMPGCQQLVKIGQNEYAMKMKLVLASISGLFDGKIQLMDHSSPNSFRLVVEGLGKIGFLKGDGFLEFKPNGDGTVITYAGDVQVGGTISAVGQRLLDTTARMLIKRFFDKLSNTLPKNEHLLTKNNTTLPDSLQQLKKYKFPK